jgi:hypothetical protein
MTNQLTIHVPIVLPVPGFFPKRYAVAQHAHACDLIRVQHAGSHCYFAVLADGDATIGLDGGWPTAGDNTERYARRPAIAEPVAPSEADKNTDWR